MIQKLSSPLDMMVEYESFNILESRIENQEISPNLAEKIEILQSMITEETE